MFFFFFQDSQNRSEVTVFLLYLGSVTADDTLLNILSFKSHPKVGGCETPWGQG